MDQERELQELTGTVESVIYKNEDNGYTVLRLRSDNGESVTVVGTFPFAAGGENMVISGDWTNHPTHGRQFKAEFAQRLMPTDAAAIYSYLAGGAVKGIGPATASLLVDRFGDQTLNILENEPDKLAAVKGISIARARELSKAFRQQTGMRRLMEFICSFGLRPILAMRLYKFYADEALALVQENPYLLAATHIGGSFAEADALALQMGLEGNSRARLQAAVLFELRHNAGRGHCFIPRDKLAAVTASLTGVSPEEIDESIGALIESGQLVYEEIAGCKACYLPELYEAERDTAAILARLSRESFQEDVDLGRLVDSVQRRQQIRYAELQVQSMRFALEHQLTVLTGGPGTGKTTSLRAILAMFDELGFKTLLTAPTGRAAKRMTELTGREAATVHRLLGAKFAEDGETVVFTKNAQDRLDCDAVVLDECSMVDVQLMASLLRAMPPSARLVLVGDADQLPSVGPGNVFSAIIRSGVVPTVRLTEIFRQKADSRIVRNAHLINRGERPNLGENAGDFFRLKRLEAAGSVETITQLCAVRLPTKMGIPASEIQVLSPTRKGELGTANLNRQLQAALNPPDRDKKEKSFGDVVFREGDRVMQVRNNYDMLWVSADRKQSGLGVYNGDIGVIAAIDPENETLTVNFDGRLASYSFDLLPELEHAWAMTVHKAQGSEYRAVVFALAATSPMLLTRGVLYTGVTRARELLILVGDDSTVYTMIDNYRRSKRYSALRVRLCTLCGVK